MIIFAFFLVLIAFFSSTMALNSSFMANFNSESSGGIGKGFNVTAIPSFNPKSPSEYLASLSFLRSREPPNS